MCDIYLFLVFSGLPHVFSFIKELFINAFAKCFTKIHKTIIRLEEIFHRQICINFSTCYKKSKNSDGPPGRSPYTLQNNLVFSPAIMSQGNMIFHCTPVSIIVRNNVRILELEYLPIHHPSLFLLTFWQSKTLKG